jgi:type II secretory pathway pseudopilin PulG
MRLSRNQRGYTLIDLAVTMGIILILSTIGLFFYQSALAYARGTVCQTNVKALKKAIEAYFMENDAFPATLGQLKPRHLETGYAEALKDAKWRTMISQLLIKMDASSHAHAQFLTPENLQKYGGTENIFHCPADDGGSPSYGINASVKGKKWSEIASDEIIVAESDHYEFTLPDGLARRHRNKAFAVKKDGWIEKLDDDQVTICHDPGKPSEKTLTVPKSALSGHLGHGDTLGTCASGK